MYEPDGKPKGIDTVHGQPGTKEASRAARGAADISKRASNIDFGMGQNEGVFNAGHATGNILSDNTMHVSAVEDLNAEGFSTLTTQAQSGRSG